MKEAVGGVTESGGVADQGANAPSVCMESADHVAPEVAGGAADNDGALVGGVGA